VVLLVLACAGHGESADRSVTPATRHPSEADSSPRPPPGTLWRDEVVATVDLGLGAFLGRVEVEESLVDHRFQGFRIVALRPPEFWKGVDLRPGDIVTSVNGMSIERDTQAFEAFEQLRDAPELRVSLTREGKKRELRYRIVARGRAESPSRSRAKVRGAQRPEASATSTRTKADPTVGDPPVEGDTPVKRQPSVRRAQGVRAAPRNPPP